MARLGAAERGSARQGVAGNFLSGMQHRSWRCIPMRKHHTAWPGKAWLGKARRGSAWPGPARHGSAWSFLNGMQHHLWCCISMRKHHAAGHGMAALGTAGPGLTRRGLAWHGMELSQLDTASGRGAVFRCESITWQSRARRGAARQGMPWQGTAWPGKAWNFLNAAWQDQQDAQSAQHSLPPDD